MMSFAGFAAAGSTESRTYDQDTRLAICGHRRKYLHFLLCLCPPHRERTKAQQEVEDSLFQRMKALFLPDYDAPMVLFMLSENCCGVICFKNNWSRLVSSAWAGCGSNA